ncbi:hypothetical protein IXO134_023710 (plasmid) [Xanthomonas oryzae pv. oryzae]|nr:hypothetical protein IXO134_023710 [Xanthomonas oryzae pv. oryzae]
MHAVACRPYIHRLLAGKPRQVGRWVIGEDGTRRRLLSFAPGDRFTLALWEPGQPVSVI